MKPKNEKPITTAEILDKICVILAEICFKISYRVIYENRVRRKCMIEKNNNINWKADNSIENFRVWITSQTTCNRLNTLSVEWL